MRIARPWAGVKKSDILGKAGAFFVIWWGEKTKKQRT
jgi:hypothetical protein